MWDDMVCTPYGVRSTKTHFMQAEGKRICSVHLSDHETGEVSALELLLTACICTICMYWLSVLRISAPEWMIYHDVSWRSDIFNGNKQLNINNSMLLEYD